MEKRKRKKRFNKRKIIVITILILIFTGILSLINNLIPIKNVNKDNININLSTIKVTGNPVIANISTKTNYNVFYFIDYSVSEEEYYEDQELSTNTITNTSILDKKKTLNIKQISDNEYKKVENSKIEIVKNGIVYLKYERFGKLSSIPYVFEITNIDKESPEIGEIETQSTYTTISVTVHAIDNNSSNLQYYFRLANSNTYISNGSNNTYTFSELTTDETYTIYVKVIDTFGNEAEAVTEATASIEQEIIEKKVYHFKVNVSANTVTVYDKDDNGKYTNPIKAFICSTGKSTPKSGTYKISDRYRWRSLFGGVYGQYAVRIYGNILFHSVPYEKMYPNTLEYEEYDKLGTSASLGCVRLCVKDAKWIYDNAKAGSTVEFYSDSSNPGPLGKPKSQKISDNKSNRNWDPTDPDKHNPWLGGDGSVTKVTIINDDDNEIINSKTSTNNNSNTTINGNDTSNIKNSINNDIVWNTID